MVAPHGCTAWLLGRNDRTNPYHHVIEIPVAYVAGAVLSRTADCKATHAYKNNVHVLHISQLGWRAFTFYAKLLLCGAFGLHWSQASAAALVRWLAGTRHES
jgi:hypothetical protein